jgi:ABC-type multidrug transport system fused ATPase/permease subunit
MRHALSLGKLGRRLRARAPYFLDGNRDYNYAPRVTEDAQKNHRRRTWLFACVGVILGIAGASAWGPKLVSFFFKPLEDSFSCSSSVNQALTQFVWLQLTLAVLGGVLALLVLFFWRRFMRQRAEAKQSRSASS